jgi:hypothetical protein
MADICCSPSTSEFTCFPKLPREIQDQMSDMATYTQADSHPPRIHPIASDLDTRHPPSLDSDLRYRPRSFYPEIQLRLAHRSNEAKTLIRLWAFGQITSLKKTVKQYCKISLWENQWIKMVKNKNMEHKAELFVHIRKKRRNKLSEPIVLWKTFIY